MAEVTISLGPHGKVGSKKLDRFVRMYPRQLKQGLLAAGAVILKDWREKIGGDGFVRNPGRSKPYPGVLRGQYFRTLVAKLISSDTGVRIGPNVDYAGYHEHPHKGRPARPVLKPVFQAVGEKAIDKLQKKLAEPLGR